ncbi:DUF1361 domain-containing protein [Sporolactobacillus sp. STCC-11]|uniref:DUF1361 domain-containing protein n=1 Tax=Sporolactobacillus caesalpiniae TaxID=3230362 RepID=UPI003397455E
MFQKKYFSPNPVLYCIVFYILFSLILYALTKRTIHVMMLWNLLLAFLPLIFAACMCLANAARDWLRTWVLGLLWLIFFPNAPYLVTDFIHLQGISFYTTGKSIVYSNDFLSWLSLIHIGIGTFVGTCSGMLSMWIIHHRFLQKFAPPIVSIIMTLIFIISGCAMYIGRFLRLNSWDLFYPTSFLSRVTHHVSAFSIGFSLLSACYIFMTYYFFSVLFTAIVRLGEQLR